MAVDRGLVDGIGELRAVMRARYGDKVRLRPFTAERRRWPLWGRLPFAAREPAAAIVELADWIEAPLLWPRFGLGGPAALLNPPALRRRSRRRHLPSGDGAARPRARALARCLCSALTPSGRWPVRRKPQPGAAAPPAPGHP